MYHLRSDLHTYTHTHRERGRNSKMMAVETFRCGDEDEKKRVEWKLDGNFIFLTQVTTATTFFEN